MQGRRNPHIESSLILFLGRLPKLSAKLQIVVNRLMKHFLQLAYGSTVKCQRIAHPDYLPHK